MADDADNAQVEIERNDPNSRARLVLPNKRSLTQCRLCDDPIPVERQVAYQGVELCIDCQIWVDKKGSHA